MGSSMDWPSQVQAIQVPEASDASAWFSLGLEGPRIVPDDPRRELTVDMTIALNSGCRQCFYYGLLILVRGGKDIKSATVTQTPTAGGAEKIDLRELAEANGFGLQSGDLLILSIGVWCLIGGAACASTATYYMYYGADTEALKGHLTPQSWVTALETTDCRCSMQFSRDSVTYAGGAPSLELPIGMPDSCTACFARGMLTGLSPATTASWEVGIEVTTGANGQRKLQMSNITGMLKHKPGDKGLLMVTLTCLDRRGRPCISARQFVVETK